jgi:hypothetical protein
LNKEAVCAVVGSLETTSSYECDCKNDPRFTGEYCQYSLCQPNPCFAGGTCGLKESIRDNLGGIMDFENKFATNKKGPIGLVSRLF